MTPTYHELLMTLQTINNAQTNQISLAQSLSQLGFSGVLPQRFQGFLNAKLSERDASIMIQLLSDGCVTPATQTWKEITFLDGGELAPSITEKQGLANEAKP